MLTFSNPTNYVLVDNGVDIETAEGAHVVDLHNDCEILGVTADKKLNKVTVSFEKTSAHNHDSILKMGSKFNIVFEGSAPSPLEFIAGQPFEGIYDITDHSLTISIGDRAYNIQRGGSSGPELQLI